MPQVLREVEWLNEAYAEEILALEQQLQDIEKLLNERNKKIEQDSALSGKQSSPFQGVSDPELEMLAKERCSISNRSAPFLAIHHPSMCSWSPQLSRLGPQCSRQRSWSSVVNEFVLQSKMYN
jgi:hypothetical protein